MALDCVVESPKNIAGSGKSSNGVPLHPNQDKITCFATENSVSYEYRMELRDAVSYARALKCGGWKLPILEASRYKAFTVVDRWNRRRAARLTPRLIEAVVEFVYNDPEL